MFCNFHPLAFRLTDFEVLLGSTTLADVKANKNMKLCMRHNGSVPRGAVAMLECTTPQKARYVKIRLLNKGILTLCEVEVYAA